MKSWSLKFATQTLFRRSGSELFDTFTNIILLRIFPLQNIYSRKIFRKIKWHIPGEPLAARYNWCQGPVPGRGPAVEKHWSKGKGKEYKVSTFDAKFLRDVSNFHEHLWSDVRTWHRTLTAIRASQQILAISDTIRIRSAVPEFLESVRGTYRDTWRTVRRIFETLWCENSKNNYFNGLYYQSTT